MEKEFCQDKGLCFSPDGEHLYNIESLSSGPFNTKIVHYQLENMVYETVIPSHSEYRFDEIRFSTLLNTYCVLGYANAKCLDIIEKGHFVAFFDAKRFTGSLSVSERDAYHHYMILTK